MDGMDEWAKDGMRGSARVGYTRILSLSSLCDEAAIQRLATSIAD